MFIIFKVIRVDFWNVEHPDFKKENELGDEDCKWRR